MGPSTEQQILAELRSLRRLIESQGSPTLTVQQAGVQLGCSRARVFQLIAEGRLARATRAGRKTMVLAASITRYLIEPPTVPRPKRQRRSRAAGLLVGLEAARKAF